MPLRSRGLTAGQVARIVKPLAGGRAILVGGQALFFWGEFFARSARDIGALRPFTSRDVDFYGFEDAARSLAAGLNATARFPRASDHTPSTALVEAQVGRRRIVIDFLGHVAGVPDKPLRRRAVRVDIGPALGLPDDLEILVQHPVHCLMGRATNAMSPAMLRRDRRSLRRLDASVRIVREWIRWRLAGGDVKEATASLRELFQWLRGNEHAQALDLATGIDPLAIIRSAAADGNWPRLYRERTIAGMIGEIERRRAARAKRQRARREVR